MPLEGSREATPLYGEAGLDEIDAFLRFHQSAIPVATQVTVPLSEREIEVLALIAAGRTSRQIADELSLSIRTVGRHVTNVYNKMGAHGRADATAYVHRRGLEAS